MQNFDDDRIDFPNGFAEKFFGQRAGGAFGLEDAASGINRAIDRQAVALADDEIFLAVAGRGMDCAGALFESDVIADEAERIAIEKGMAEDDAIELGDREAREDFRFSQPSASATCGRRPSATMVAPSAYRRPRIRTSGERRWRDWRGWSRAWWSR